MDNPLDIPKILDNVLSTTHRNDGDYLSLAMVDLVRLLYRHNEITAEAEKLEYDKFAEILNRPCNGRKMTVAEAEKRAVIETDNLYGKLKLEEVSILEAINVLKIRIRQLSGEYKASFNDN